MKEIKERSTIFPFKLEYYISTLPYVLRPNFSRKYNPEEDKKQLSPEELSLVEKRVKLLNKLTEPFSLSEHKTSLSKLTFKRNSAYKLDAAKCLMGFQRNRAFDVQWGDVTEVPLTPSFVKSRPITPDNQNAVLLKLNVPRHYRFWKDPNSFREKKNTILYRGGANNIDRRTLVERYSTHPRMDVKLASKRRQHQENFLSEKSQLAHKFIVSVEGVDVASNLKWVMASNSLCVMKKPSMESWFLESQLIPNKHYIEVNEDFSNLEAVVQPFLEDPERAEQMLRDAHDYMRFLFNPHIERLTSYLVAEHYFNLAQG